MSPPRVVVTALDFTYPDGTHALRGVSFAIGEGESVAIVGANGAGKSTLLAQLTGLLHPTSGSVVIGGAPVSHATLAGVRRAIGMVFQDPDDQLFMPTVGEDVAFGPANLDLPAGEIEERVVDALNRVGALGLRDRAPYRLSSGEKRAVAIATVLAMRPQVLVLDEPSASLDGRARRRLIALLGGFAHTKLIATHDLDMALALCERTIVIAGGLIAADGRTADLFRDEAMLASCGLERPLTMQGCPVCGDSAVRRPPPRAT